MAPSNGSQLVNMLDTTVMTICPDTTAYALPRKHFLHEAAHAIASHSLGVILQKMWIEVPEDPRLTHGSVAPHKEQDLGLAEFAFIKMSGPAAHLSLGGHAFDTETNIFRSDFTSVLSRFPDLNRKQESAAWTLMVCKQFLDGYCTSWAMRHAGPIERLASTLQSATLGSIRYELSDDRLDDALKAAIGADEISSSELRVDINEAFYKVWRALQPFEPPSWLKYYLDCVRS